MKIKILFLILFTLICYKHSAAQNTIVTFTSDKDSEILIYEPLDGGYNEKVYQKRLIVRPDQPAVYETQISSYIFIKTQFPQYQKSSVLILFPNDTIQLYLTDEKITFGGNNHSGLQYYHDNFIENTFLENYMKLTMIFDEYNESKRDIHSLLPAINDSLLISSHIQQIGYLRGKSKTSEEFTHVLKTNVSMLFNGYIMGFFYSILYNSPFEDMAAKDGVKIRQLIDSIYNELPVIPELNKYSSHLYVINYLSYYSRENANYLDGIEDFWGPYKKYLLAPESMHPALLGSACLVQLKYDTGEMELPKVKQYFNEKFPDSEYTAILNERIKDVTELQTLTDKHVFIKEEVNSLEELNHTQELQNKYLFIDLWASWCMPCRAEFSYKDELNNILKEYDNIAVLYISIDKERQEKAWLNCIINYNLEGYHIRASSALNQDIEKQLYGNENMTIPRYVLLAPDGEILHPDLPRPSEMSRLKDELDKVML